MVKPLPFEEPAEQLREKIVELRELERTSGLDLTEEIQLFETKLRQVERDLYEDLSPWKRVMIARHAERPTTLDYIERLFTDFIELHGDRLYGDDEAIVGGIARFNGRPVTVIGHQRGGDTKENIRRNFGMPHPEGYRKALRLMKQADKFRRPIICFIDTKGAYPGRAAEERGQSEAIARNLVEMAGLRVPVISVVIGEGGSGGALALGVANEIYMLENATYSVISPEGAASILWKDASLAQQAAEALRITAPNLLELGVIDGIVEEPLGGAHRDAGEQARALGEALQLSLARLSELAPDALVDQRFRKYMAIGRFSD